jgi:hypothetical protein
VFENFVLSVVVARGSNFLVVGFNLNPPVTVLLKSLVPFAAFSGLVGTLLLMEEFAFSTESIKEVA